MKKKKAFVALLIAIAVQSGFAQSLEKMQWFNEPQKWEIKDKTLSMFVTLDNPEHMHPVQKEKESQIGSKRFDLNSHSGRYAPIFREK